MFGPFKLKSPLGRDYNVDLDDTLRTKAALRGIGYYQPPKHGLNKFPDDLLFKGIERFQSDHGLRKDGVIKPGGETERTLRAVTNAAEEKFLTGPFVSTVVVVDAAVVVSSVVVVDTAVLGAGPSGFSQDDK